MGWSSATACLGNPHQQIWGERRRTQRTEKPDVAVPSSSQLAGGASTGHGCVRADWLRLWTRGLELWTCGLELWLVVVAFNPVRVAGMWLGVLGVSCNSHAIGTAKGEWREARLNHLSWPWAKATKVQTPLCCKRCWGSVNWHNLSTVWHLVVCCPCSVPVLWVGGAFWGALRLFWKVGESHWPGWLPRPWCGAGGCWKGLQNCLPAGEEVLGSFVCSSWCIGPFLGRLAQGLKFEWVFQAQPKHPPCLTLTLAS